MRRAVLWTVAILAAALMPCGPGSAWAQTGAADPAPADAVLAEIKEESPAPFLETRSDATALAHLLLFSGADMWRNGAFMHGGFLYAYQGLNQDGPVFKLLLNGGFYRFHSAGSEITGRQVMAAALPGWRWSRPGLELTVFAGLDVQDHRYTPDDPGNRLRGTHFGARGGFDVWYEPLQDGMLTASASLSTVGKSYWTRAAAGWRFFDAIW